MSPPTSELAGEDRNEPMIESDEEGRRVLMALSMVEVLVVLAVGGWDAPDEEDEDDQDELGM